MLHPDLKKNRASWQNSETGTLANSRDAFDQIRTDPI